MSLCASQAEPCRAPPWGAGHYLVLGRQAGVSSISQASLFCEAWWKGNTFLYYIIYRLHNTRRYLARLGKPSRKECCFCPPSSDHRGILREAGCEVLQVGSGRLGSEVDGIHRRWRFPVVMLGALTPARRPFPLSPMTSLPGGCCALAAMNPPFLGPQF